MSIRALRAKYRLKLASAAKAEGRLAEARQACEQVFQICPYSARGYLCMASVLLAERATDLAIRQLRKVAESGGGPCEVAKAIVPALRRKGDLTAALDWAKLYAQSAPNEPLSYFELGRIQHEVGELSQAKSNLEIAVKLRPAYHEAHFILALVLTDLGSHKDALASFKAAAELCPDHLTYAAHLADAFLSDMRPQEALALAELLVRTNTESPIVHELRTQALLACNREPDAETEARLAVSCDPSSPWARALLGTVLQVLGKMSEAEQECRCAIQLEPNQGIAYFNIARGRRATKDSLPMVHQMERLAAGSSLDIKQLELLEYAIAKSFEDLEEYEQSIQHYDAANAVAYRRKFGSQPFDMKAHEARFRWLQTVYTRDFIKKYGQFGDDTSLPIFVLGMMRSGTTLVEQILSSHPEICGVGEQKFWPQNHKRAFIDSECEPDPAILSSLASDYLRTLKDLAPGFLKVVDKMPANYLHLGLIRTLFPKSRIIHVHRDPADTCFSIYATQNRVRIPWGNVKQNIALNYKRYLQLMEHWDAVLPPCSVFDLSYEDLVQNPEAVIPELIDFCGLPWSERCLRHEQNSKGVTTPSVWQVRQPVYRTSIGRWKRFRPWLAEFASLEGRLDGA